ncbi:hypothetical protein AAMO2058_000699500 [Amorphochlora amoebiformis]
MAPMAINTLSHSHLRLPVQPFKPPQFVPVPSLSRTHFSSRRKLGSLKFRLPLPTATKEDDVAEGQKPYNYEPLSKSQLLSRSYEGSSILRSKSMRRILIPSIVAAIGGTILFPAISIALRGMMDLGEIYVISNDQGQFIQNFVTVNGLLFSILTGNAFYFLYQQQESLFYALFSEVSEAKSLLEQATFVCQGRPFYGIVLEKIRKYVKDDLRRVDYPPATLLSSKPEDDPLESILYLTSVGIPSIVYETVRALRQARGRRLAATQRKLPKVHFVLLYVLSFIELVSFPLIGAATSAAHMGSNILTVEGLLFGMLCGGIMLTLQVTLELWNPIGGAYNVDAVLNEMVMGLEAELEQRFKGIQMADTQLPSLPPSFASKNEEIYQYTSKPDQYSQIPSQPPPQPRYLQQDNQPQISSRPDSQFKLNSNLESKKSQIISEVELRRDGEDREDEKHSSQPFEIDPPKVVDHELKRKYEIEHDANDNNSSHHTTSHLQGLTSRLRRTISKFKTRHKA